MSTAKLVLGSLFILAGVGILIAMLIMNLTLWLIVPAVIALFTGWDFTMN